MSLRTKTIALHDKSKDKYGKENTEFKHMGGHYVPNKILIENRYMDWVSWSKRSCRKHNIKPKYDENNKEIPDLDEDLLKSIDNLAFDPYSTVYIALHNSY